MGSTAATVASRFLIQIAPINICPGVGGVRVAREALYGTSYMKRSASSIWLDCLVSDDLAPRLWSSRCRTLVGNRREEIIFNVLYSENCTQKALLGLRRDVELKRKQNKNQ